MHHNQVNRKDECQRPRSTRSRSVHRAIVRATGPLIFFLGAISTANLYAVESNGAGAPVVRTRRGPIRGEAEKGALVFRGIPFAAAPVGRLRFRPPMAPTPWTEVRPALDFAPACPQLVDIDPTENNNSVMAEDCLAVNVWTPKNDSLRRPVMVWIHGGGFVEGSARNTWYDGAALAKRGDVVVVTLQYRLGAWGYLELSELGGPEYAESGNLGILDQIAALQWVHDNIAAFGGDPQNVTLFGQSAGAGGIGILMITPLARGLFHRAILESGTPKELIDKAHAIGVSRTYMKSAGVSSIEQLRNLSMAQMRDAQRKLFETSIGASFRPIVDGALIREWPMRVIEAGRAASVPILLGTNLDEIRLWPALYDVAVEQKLPSLLERQVAEIADSSAQRVIGTYRNAEADYRDAVIHLIGDLIMRLPSIRLAEANSRVAPTYMYQFTYRSTSFYKNFGSCHGMELPFVFGVTDQLDAIVFTGRDPRRENVMKRLQQAWINFARTGDPSQAGLLWPKYDEKNRATLQLGINSQVVNDPNSAERALWNGLAFDGVTPSAAKIWALVWENGVP